MLGVADKHLFSHLNEEIQIARMDSRFDDSGDHWQTEMFEELNLRKELIM